MKSFDQIEMRIGALMVPTIDADPVARASEFVALGEQILEQWLEAHGQTPTSKTKEGFRLLALQRQGSKGNPSFNACRETCRELAYHNNLVQAEPDHPDTAHRMRMTGMIARHLLFFVSGKMQVAELGEFCCSSRPLRADGN